MKKGTRRVLVAMGSNLDSAGGTRHEMLRGAARFLGELAGGGGEVVGVSDGIESRAKLGPVRLSSIWESDPLGPALHPFLNAVAEVALPIQNEADAAALLGTLKAFERACGREETPVRWGPRVLDLDILDVDSLSVHTQTLIIPHPEAHCRLFVLRPLQELRPGWEHPSLGRSIDSLLRDAPPLNLRRTTLEW